MKKYLFLAVAALGLAACAEKGLDNGPVQNGELEQSYMAITLAADDMNTKADHDKDAYEEGLESERAVNLAYVFFFKDGEPFYVAFDGTTSTNARPNNYVQVQLPANGNEMPNVSDVKEAVLVIQNYQGEYPNQVVAVLNWEPKADEYTLDNLMNVVTNLEETGYGFVMSNAVYADAANQAIYATDLTIANIGKTANEALANPVTIHVERVAAKVVFTAANDGLFSVGKEIDGTPVYAKIMGYELFNDYETSRLVKKIDPTWNVGFNWNDADWFRSYWAESIDTEFPNNSFAWSTDNEEIGTYVYCGENTRPWTVEDDVRTKVVVKAQLVMANGETPIEITNWYGKDYLGEGTLRTVVANTLKNTYFYGNDEDTVFTGLLPEDIKCVARDVNEENAFEVYFQLSETGDVKTWYKYEGGNYTPIAIDAINTELAAVQPALVYTNGMTYYYTNIQHLGAPASAGQYGVVRNHVYKVNITGVVGYGTPVYNGTTGYVSTEKPDQIETYVAAQINVLSWRIVEQDTILQ